MKSFLVLIGGSGTDRAVFETALAAARPFAAHLQFLHVRIGAGEAAVFTPHADFTSGPALVDALQDLEMEAEDRSFFAAGHFRDFCARSNIEISDMPGSSQGVTASWHEKADSALERIVFHARHNDLVVTGRAHKPNGLPPDFLERLLLDCGRPVLIAGSSPSQTVTGTIMVCWRESADAARALTAAMPFLASAKRVLLVSVAERNEVNLKAMNGLARQFAWNQVPAEVRVVEPDGRAAQEILAAAADSCDADLVVMGAYGHSRLREALFGGCTDTFVRDATRAVLLMH